jgi:hypothetical protein
MLLATFVAACSSTHGATAEPSEAGTTAQADVSFVTQGADANATETNIELLGSTLVSSLVSSPAADLLSLGSGNGAPALFLPVGCLAVGESTTADAGVKTATYSFTFDNCTGPSGLRNLTGHVTVVHDAAADPKRGIALTVKATDLALNHATVDIDATTTVTAPTASTRSMTYVTNKDLTGTTAGKRKLSRTTHLEASWTIGESCFALSGFSTGAVDDRAIRIDVLGFRRCRQACPDTDGSVTITDVTTNAQYKLLYDGTDKASFTEPNGTVVSVPLLCND